MESPLPNIIHLPPRSQPYPHPNRFSQPPMPVSPSNSSSILKRASLQTSIQTSANPYPSHLSTGDTMRVKKRTPGRIRKLLGDFYLLSGRLPDAVNQ